MLNQHQSLHEISYSLGMEGRTMNTKRTDVDGFIASVLGLLTESLKSKKVTQVALARALGVHENTIANYKHGLHGRVRPPFQHVLRLAEELGMSREDILKKLYPKDLEDVAWLLENEGGMIEALKEALDGAAEDDKEQIINLLRYVKNKRPQ